MKVGCALLFERTVNENVELVRIKQMRTLHWNGDVSQLRSINLVSHHVQFVHFTKVIPVNGEGDRKWEFPWVMEQSPEKKFPIMFAFLAFNPDFENGTQ